MTPNGCEDYFRKVAEYLARTGGMPDAARTAELTAQHQTVLADPTAHDLS